MELRLLRYYVTVVDEGHIGRAATRLHMTQPPLSRAIKQLETEVGVRLLDRTPSGVSTTAVGATLYQEAQSLLRHAEQVHDRVASAVGSPTLTLGTLADSAESTGADLATAFRERHPEIRVRLHEADFTDPTGGLRSGAADVAITRTPFDQTGIVTQTLREDPVGVLVRADDPLARRTTLHLADLEDRPWFRFPEGTDPIWTSFWSTRLDGTPRDGPMVRTIAECIQAVLWNGTVGLVPLNHPPIDGVRAVRLVDMPTSWLVVAWNRGDTNPLVRAFTRVARLFSRAPEVPR
jgi:DNA-binding transcriptional LysR family regulator